LFIVVSGEINFVKVFHLIEIVPIVPTEILLEVEQNRTEQNRTEQNRTEQNKQTNKQKTQTSNTKLLQELDVTVTQTNHEVISENAGIKNFTIT